MQSEVPTSHQIFSDLSRALRGQPWYGAATTHWPAPIANELQQLMTMLDDGSDAGGILMQTRDAAEVLLKILTITCVADMGVHGEVAEAERVKARLIGDQNALGGWVDLFIETSKGMPSYALTMPQLAPLANTKGTFLNAAWRYVEARNRDIGHGAYRPDSLEIARLVRAQWIGDLDEDHGRKGGLDQAFRAVAESGLWNACVMRLDGPDGSPFAGADRIAEVRGLHSDHGRARDRRVVLTRDERMIDLAPFLSGRVCQECGERDAFLFDAPKSRRIRRDPRFIYLDYANGHALSLDARNADVLLMNLVEGVLSDGAFAQTVGRDGEFTSREVAHLLDDIMFDNRFISPEWLREALALHMRSHTGGGFWVRAPAHVGKTMFVRGLFGEGLRPDQAEAERAFLGDESRICVLPVFLKREYRFDAAQFTAELETRARSLLGSDSRLASALSLLAKPQDAPARFVDFAEAALGAVRMRGFERLIIAFDGLDELPDPGDGPSAIDFLPLAAALPEGVTLLLTSRPLADCPTWLRLRLSDRPELAEVLEAGVDHEGYRALLRAYIAQFSGVAAEAPDFQDLFDAIMDRSQGLFLFVSFLCDLIREGVGL